MVTGDITKALESDTGKLVSGAIMWAFRALIVALVTLAGWNFRDLSTKVENAVPKEALTKAVTDSTVQLTEAKAEQARQQQSLWQAMGTVTKSVNELTTNITVLGTRVELNDHNTQRQIDELKAQVKPR